MNTKHVCESLNQFHDYKFFNLLEKEDEKKEIQDNEKSGLNILKKAETNFKRFQSASGNKIAKYKEFWEENQEAKQNFSEQGNIYKLFDSSYVIGVLTLPDSAISDETINKDVEKIEEDEAFNLDGASDLNKHAEGTDVESPKEETVEGSDLDKPETDEESTADFEIPDDTTQPEESKPSFVVYDMSGGEREEIFRCLSNNVIKAFNEFY